MVTIANIMAALFIMSGTFFVIDCFERGSIADSAFFVMNSCTVFFVSCFVHVLTLGHILRLTLGFYFTCNTDTGLFQSYPRTLNQLDPAYIKFTLALLATSELLDIIWLFMNSS